MRGSPKMIFDGRKRTFNLPGVGNTQGQRAKLGGAQ